jgi:2-polyprenyl-3-methyl-5-hydroxy-6-metoxy-1,4-benzoquinol methylase
MLRHLIRMIRSGIPSHIKKKFISVDNDGLENLRRSLKEHYFRNLDYSPGITSDDYLSTQDGKLDMENHVFNRLKAFREGIIPWLDTMKKLSGSKILEIGCGTGCSTVALAEQGALMTGIDVSEPAIRVAELRMKEYGLRADFRLMNATEIDRVGEKSFDHVIFFAALEHMTIDERIVSIKKAWELLPEGGMLSVIETPNRLWYFDDHTSNLPFFHWLPDQLAFYYAARSPRKTFCNFDARCGSLPSAQFARLGRGVSYHEFEIALGKDIKAIRIAGDLQTYNDKKRLNPFKILKKTNSIESKYPRLFRKVFPDIHPAFLTSYLNLSLLR